MQSLHERKNIVHINLNMKLSKILLHKLCQ